MAYDMTKKY